MRFKITKILAFVLLITLTLTSCGKSDVRNYVSLNYHTSNEYRVKFNRLLITADKIIYGEVVSRSSDSELFGAFYKSDYGYGLDNLCFTDVNIKVLRTFKGDAADELVYRELGGKSEDTVYYSNNTGALAVGDKAVLFLSENNMLVGIESAGRFKETADGGFYVDKDILEEGIYENNYLTRKKIAREEFFTYLEEEIKNSDGSKVVIEPEINEITELSKTGNLEDIYKNISTAVYGEVVDVEDADIYDVCLSSGRMACYIKSDVKIKVIDKIKGSCGDIVTYYQPGGEKNGIAQSFSALESLSKGDKVIICLTEGGVVLHENGFYKVNENGKIYTADGEKDVSSYVKYLKEEFKKIEEKIKAEEEKNKNNNNRNNSESSIACYAYNMYEIENLGLIENTDVIICGKAEFGRKDIMYNPRSNGKNNGNCYTQINLTDAKCFYNRYGSTSIKEITFLQNGGERDGVEFKGSGFGVKESENTGETVFVFLQYDGANYLVRYLMQVKEDGTIEPIKTLVPKDYRERFEKEKTAANYGEILAEYIENVE